MWKIYKTSKRVIKLMHFLMLKIKSYSGFMIPITCFLLERLQMEAKVLENSLNNCHFELFCVTNKSPKFLLIKEK